MRRKKSHKINTKKVHAFYIRCAKKALRVSVITSEPSLFILDNCKNLVYAFQHNVWESDKEKQGQFAKDFLDLARFACMDEPKFFIKPEKDMGRSKWARQPRNFTTNTFGGSE